MKLTDLTSLIGGPYHPPPLRVGDIATCLYRDCDVVITSWSDGRISWPRCRSRDSHGSGSGLLVDETLLAAIETESVTAIMYWFGVTHNTVRKWRRAFDVGARGTPGTLRLYEATAEKVAEATRGKPLPAEAVHERQKRAIELNLADHLRKYEAEHRRQWTDQESALIGTMPDTRLARQLACTRDGVRRERERLGIPRYRKPPPPESFVSPEEREALRRERIAAGKRGKPRPPHVVEAVRKAHLGKKASAETRDKLAAAASERAKTLP